MCLCSFKCSAYYSAFRSKTLTSLDPMFDSYCIFLIEWPCANAGDCRSQPLSQTGNTEKINQQLSIIDREWHHRIETGPHTWINANKYPCTMMRHLRNLQSICSLNSGPFGPLPFCRPVGLLCPLCFVPRWKPDSQTKHKTDQQLHAPLAMIGVCN